MASLIILFLASLVFVGVQILENTGFMKKAWIIVLQLFSGVVIGASTIETYRFLTEKSDDPSLTSTCVLLILLGNIIFACSLVANIISFLFENKHK